MSRWYAFQGRGQGAGKGEGGDRAPFALLVVMFVAGVLQACGPQRLDPLPDEWPASVLVAPVQNETPDLDAPALVRPMMVHALAERGYYVLPTVAVQTLLERERLGEAGAFAQVPPSKVAEAIGCEAILYLNIRDWSSKYLAVTSVVSVEIEGALVDTRTGVRLWEDGCAIHETPGGGGAARSQSVLGALVGLAVESAVHAALAPYRPLAQEAVSRLARGIPPGPLHPLRNLPPDE